MKELSPPLCCSKCKNRVFASSDNPMHKEGDAVAKKFLFFETGEYLYREGETAEGMYCIYTGAVRIFKTHKWYSEATVHHATNGEMLGFNSISEGKYINSATATEDTYLCFIPLTEIKRLITELSSLTEKIISSKY